MKALTKKERALLYKIVAMYDRTENDNICFLVYHRMLTRSGAGVLGSLVKKGMIYDAFADLHDVEGHEQSNYFPMPVAVDLYDALLAAGFFYMD